MVREGGGGHKGVEIIAMLTGFAGGYLVGDLGPPAHSIGMLKTVQEYGKFSKSNWSIRMVQSSSRPA